ncbi:hypothetical protein POVWA2_035150 [Plasmodium ovale wallikeri]|uniref:Uncharacterized protein n=1 Tax=Plasmodium ovale wallikeri TaxID=864142 RepID=A0A1A8Z0X7_PLAOA|nr:hypothetical protein POVWA1_035860 [Plasmodium ovale wallikeri]SBT38204.1 hypothetical protein POVWA2_035150 [Plasmodium ovale wallikeri]
MVYTRSKGAVAMYHSARLSKRKGGRDDNLGRISRHCAPFRAISYHFVPFRAISYHFVPFRAISYHFVPFRAILCHFATLLLA